MLKRSVKVAADGVRGGGTAGPALVSLGHASRGFSGTVASVGHGAAAMRPGGGLDAAELERRLLEIGFVEGARVELLHEGAFGGDPIVVKLDDMRVALRRREAEAVMVAVPAGGAYRRRAPGRRA